MSFGYRADVIFPEFRERCDCDGNSWFQRQYGKKSKLDKAIGIAKSCFIFSFDPESKKAISASRWIFPDDHYTYLDELGFDRMLIATCNEAMGLALYPHTIKAVVVNLDPLVRAAYLTEGEIDLGRSYAYHNECAFNFDLHRKNPAGAMFINDPTITDKELIPERT